MDAADPSPAPAPAADDSSVTRSLKPAIILVEPQLAENIGATARAMKNCGLDDLRLVQPRGGWPNEAAWPMASGADSVLEAARVFDDLDSAVADLERLYATTARHRDMVKHELTPRRLAAEIHGHAVAGARSGVLFGRERIGLLNDEVASCDAIVVVPLDPAFTSLNLAQAVLLIAYEYFQERDETPARVRIEADSRAATRDELRVFFERLEASLVENGFFRVEEMRPVQWRKIRNLVLRAEPTEQEVRILHGILSALEGRKRPR
ncbi:MAG: RNA methyltransferase [Acidobacteriota bacterium]